MSCSREDNGAVHVGYEDCRVVIVGGHAVVAEYANGYEGAVQIWKEVCLSGGQG